MVSAANSLKTSQLKTEYATPKKEGSIAKDGSVRLLPHELLLAELSAYLQEFNQPLDDAETDHELIPPKSVSDLNRPTVEELPAPPLDCLDIV